MRVGNKGKFKKYHDISRLSARLLISLTTVLLTDEISWENIQAKTPRQRRAYRPSYNQECLRLDKIAT